MNHGLLSSISSNTPCAALAASQNAAPDNIVTCDCYLGPDWDIRRIYPGG